MRHPIASVPRLALLALVLAVGAGPVVSQEATPLTPEQLVAVEKIRPEVEAVFALLREPDQSPIPVEKRFEAFVKDLTRFGPDVGPFLAAELDLPDVRTFNVAAYAMGLVDYPGAVASLRAAADVAEKEGGAYGRARNEWAIYGLALHGDVGAVGRALAGEMPAGWNEFMEGYRFLEVVSVLTAPASVAKLGEELARLDADETLHPRLDVPLMALGATGDPAAVPTLIKFLKHKRLRAREEAARSLGRIGDAAALDALFAALKDPEVRVQTAAAIALERMLPNGRLEDLLAALETAEDPYVRGVLYRAIAGVGGEPMLEVLRANARRPSSYDRTLLALAVGEMGSRRGLNLLRSNLTDSSLDVVLQSMRSLDRIGGDGATDTLVALVNDRRRPVAQAAMELLTNSRVERAAPRIAQRLLGDFLSAPVRDPEVRTLVEKACEGLVRLGYHAPRREIGAAADGQTDPVVVEMLKRTAGLLDALATNGKDDAKWVEALGSGDDALRLVAIDRLGELGTERAAAALAAAYEKSPGSHALEILTALARSRSAAAVRPLLEKIVTNPAWDAGERGLERAWAAWGLRRIGGPAALAALKASAERRGGADWPVVLYYAQIAGPDGLRLARSSRAPRLRDHEWYRGEEQAHLETLIVRLSNGRSVADSDVAPDRLHLH